MKTTCAWCLAERHIKPNPNDSHGICSRHYREILTDLRPQREQSMEVVLYWVLILVLCLVIGLALGAGAAVWESILK